VEGVSFPSSDHRLMLSSPRVKGALPSSSTKKVQDISKQLVHDEGPFEGQEKDFILIQDEDTDLGSQGSKLKEIIKEQEADIHDLSLKLERAMWIINYVEQRNKQLEDQQKIMELQNIRENRQAVKRRKVKLTLLQQEVDADRESWLERANMHLEKLLEKSNKEKKKLRHMAFHYFARNKICKTRIMSLKAKLRKTLRRKKEQDKLKILAEASLAEHST